MVVVGCDLNAPTESECQRLSTAAPTMFGVYMREVIMQVEKGHLGVEAKIFRLGVTDTHQTLYQNGQLYGLVATRHLMTKDRWSVTTIKKIRALISEYHVDSVDFPI